MFTETRTTRSRNKFLPDSHDSPIKSSYSHYMLDTSTMLTPPMSQQEDDILPRRGRPNFLKRSNNDTNAIGSKLCKYGGSPTVGSSISTTMGPCTLLPSFESELEMQDALDYINRNALTSPENDPDMFQAVPNEVDSTTECRDQEINMPGSPDMLITTQEDHMDMQPYTPMMRPNTPGGDMGSPFTPIVSSSLDTFDPLDQPMTPYPIPMTPMGPPSRKKHASVRDGRLLEIRMKNFMAHADFNIFLNPETGNIWFVNGQNGAGKSAMIHSVQFAFGHLASHTNRANSSKDFIKWNCPSATVQVKVSNYNGTLPHDTYGEEIDLTRVIYTNGSSVYKLKVPGTDKYRQINRQKLNYIKSALRIDPNNPIQFYQQERGKENSKKGTKEAFQKDHALVKDATGVTEYEKLLSETEMDLKESVKAIEAKQEHLKIFEQEKEALKGILKKIKKLQNYETEIETQNIELVWTEVREWEVKLKEIQNRIVEQHNSIDAVTKKKEQLREKREHLVSEISKWKKSIDSINEEAKNFQLQEESKQKDLKDANKTIERVSIVIEGIKKAINDYTSKKMEYEKEEKQETETFEEHNQDLRCKIEKCENEIPTKIKELKKLKQDRDDQLLQINRCKERKKQAEEKIKQLKKDRDSLNRELNKKDNYYGKGIKELINKIQRMQWINKPVGPIGSCITVKDSKYAPIIEYILGPSTLCCFIVQNSSDFNKIKGLIDEIWPKDNFKGKKASVFWMKGGYGPGSEFSQNLERMEKKLSKFKTVFSLLNIEDECLKRGLVDKTGCERIAIYESFEKCCVDAKANDNRIPPEISKIYCPAILNPHEWYSVSPMPRYSVRPQFGVEKISQVIPMEDTEDARISINQEIEREQQAADTCQQSLKGYREPGQLFHVGFEDILRNTEAKIKEIQLQLNQLEHDKKYYESLIKTPVEKQDKDLRKQIEDEEARIQEQENSLQQRQKQIQCANLEKVNLEKEIADLQRRSKETQVRLDALKKDYNEAQKSLKIVEREIAENKAKAKPLDTELFNFTQEETKVTDQVNKRTKIAESTGIRPKQLSGKSPIEIKEKIESIKVSLYTKENKELLQSFEAVTEEYNNKVALIGAYTKELNDILTIENRCQPYIKVVKGHLENEKANIANILSSNFQTFVENHALTGKLLMNWKDDTLIYYISPDEAAEERVRKLFSLLEGEVTVNDYNKIHEYIKSLSGGEFSKSRFYFLFSAWQLFDCPFYMVDEFETNMDQPSIIKIQNVLLKHASVNPEILYFFSTPLTLVGIPPQCIIRLKKISSNDQIKGNGSSSTSSSKQLTLPVKRKAIEDTPRTSKRRAVTSSAKYVDDDTEEEDD